MSDNRPTRHSYSSLRTYKECPAKYAYSYIDRIPSPPSAAMDRGSRLHKLCEDYLGGGLPSCPYDIRRIGVKIFQMRGKGALPEQTWLLDKDWYATENPGDAMLKAIIDVHYMDSGVLKIHDYKSGREYPEHQDQLELYALIGLQRFPLTGRVEASAIYIDTGIEGQPRSIIRPMLPKLRQRWDGLIARVGADGEFLPTPGGHCRRCHYRSDAGGECDAWREVNEF